MTPFKAHASFGLASLVVGVVLDYTFVAARVSDAFKTDPLPYLHSWKHLLHDMTISYMIILGFANLAFALLIPHLPGSPRLDWSILWLLVGGSALLIGTGFRYASAGPSLEWEPRCTVLTIGLLAIVAGVGLEAYKLFRAKPLVG